MSDSSTNPTSISRILDELDHILDIKIAPGDLLKNVLTNTEVSIDKSSAKNSTEFQQQFNCNNVCDLFCDYKATSKQGLKVHIKRKHTGQKKGQVICKFCELQCKKEELYGHYFISHGKLIEEETVGETITNEANQLAIKFPFNRV